MGVAIGDYDNDGRDDVYITALEGDRLFHNEGGGHFRNVTAEAGIRNMNFGASAAWVDYDLDGKLDLFVANYVKWSPETDVWCSMDGSTKSYCTPESYPGVSSKLYRNLGGGKFADVTEQAGLADPTSKSLGVVAFDYDGDGWPDLFVSNDTQPNKLYHNLKNGRFQEVGLSSGVAFGEDGVARASMGVDVADYDRSGRPHLIVGNFSNQMLGLYHNEGNGLFVDQAPRSAVGRASLLTLTFGLVFFDYDLDGYPDILAANGHLDDDIERVQPKVRYREMPLLLRNQGNGSFQEETGAFPNPLVARGLAYGDYRPRRRPGRVDRHQWRRRSSLSQRRWERQPLDKREVGGYALKPRWDRRGGARDQRRRHAMAGCAQRLQLLFGERLGAHLRTGPG